MPRQNVREPQGDWKQRSPEGTGVWSHQYGLADNSAFGGETLCGASTAGRLAVQWIGRPGPRAQADRNGRKPSPLAVGGRLFMQGLHRIIAIDAYNGASLWSLEIPHFERFNVPRDSSNWCADPAHVFAAIRGRCWRIDATDGGCGTYALTDRAVIFRAGDVKLWDFTANKETGFPRLRPGCWLSTVPACGMLLSPEAGGGCSCGSWLETSVGFIPRSPIAPQGEDGH